MNRLLFVFYSFPVSSLSIQGKKPSPRNGGNTASFFSCSVYEKYDEIKAALKIPS